MQAILSRLPDSDTITAWFERHKGKLAGLCAGTFGTLVLTTFLIVAITGVPYGGERLDPDRAVIYPNF